MLKELSESFDKNIIFFLPLSSDREMCELLFSECGHIMQTIPQLSSLNCEMAPYSNSDITMPNCAPVSPVVEGMCIESIMSLN